MGKRAALVFTFLVVVIFQWLSSDAQPPPRFYAVAPQPPMVAFQHRMPPPHMMAENRVLDQDWTNQWNYDTPYTQEDVQRRVMSRLFRKDPPSPVLEDPSKDAALHTAAQEVRDIAATFGKPEGEFANKWVAKVLATEDPKARLDIIDECFVDMTLDCEGLEDALRRFRMLLAPHTALVKESKKEVIYQASKQDGVKQAYVDEWLKKVESGQRAADPADVLDECLISANMGGPRSQECFEFEEALRNYKAAAELWTQEAGPSEPLGNRLAGMKEKLE
jgi:hypothetical protein